MTREEAALILDPETSRDALLPYESQEERIAICEEACRLGAAALREQEERRWIPVTERLPEHGDVVLCFMKFGEHRILQWDNVSSWWLCYGHGDDWKKAYVTNWMPLPPAPEDMK